MSPSIRELNLTSVYRNRVFTSNSVEPSRDFLRRALVDHRVQCGSGAVDSELYCASSRRLKMFILRYGPEVEVKPQPFEGFVLAQMPLRGSAEIESDGRCISLHAGQAAIIAPRKDIRLRWSRDCEQLLLRIPLDLVHEAASRGGASSSTRRVGALLEPATVFDGGVSAQWSGLVQSLMDLALPGEAEASTRANTAWLDHVELSLAYFLLTQQRAGDDASDADEESGHPEVLASASSEGALDSVLAAAERYMRARLCAPIALEDLARAAGVSARTLHMHCTRAFGVGPMVWLRHVRLEAARKRLEAGPECSVTDAAMEYGFGHLGRFSAYYKDRFGELPRETAAASRSSASKPN